MTPESDFRTSDFGKTSIDRVGRYVLTCDGEGIVIREASHWLMRIFERLLGRSLRTELRIATSGARLGAHPLESVADVIVRKCRPLGPGAKPTALRRNWETRIAVHREASDRSADEHDGHAVLLPVSFGFAREDEAQRFASILRRDLSALRESYR